MKAFDKDCDIFHILKIRSTSRQIFSKENNFQNRKTKHTTSFWNLMITYSTVQDFLIKLGNKTPSVHLLEISIFS